ncbi:ComEC family competence protein [Candidatus Giovannonibacteria bacterium]|nr:ComEC family competence protein [Candidatus Giovannonibacteria bacterium]
MPRFWAITFIVGFFTGVSVRSFFYLYPEIAYLFIATGIILLGIYFLRRQFIYISGAIFLLAFGVGIFRYDLKESKANLPDLSEKTGERIKITGYISEDPENLEKFTRAVFTSEQGKILLTLPHYPSVSYGDILEIEGKLEVPENFSEFDWKNYLAREDIYFQMFLPKILSQENSNGHALIGPLKKFLFEIKHSFMDNLSKFVPEPQNALLKGITAGDRSGLTDEMEENFRRAGIIHILVLSGYNISIVSDSVLKLMGYLPISRIFNVLLATFSIVLFSILTGGSATVVRAAIMGILLIYARETGKIYQALTALFFAAFLMVLLNPKTLRFDKSFQLSFMATLALILLMPRLEKYFLWVTNFFKIREHLLATISTQLFVLPILLEANGTFSLFSIPANLLILPPIPLTMFLGFITGLAAYIFAPLAALFSWFAYFFLSYEVAVAEFFSRFSFLTFEFAEFSGWLVAIFYAFLALMIFSIQDKKVIDEKKI